MWREILPSWLRLIQSTGRKNPENFVKSFISSILSDKQNICILVFFLQRRMSFQLDVDDDRWQLWDRNCSIDPTLSRPVTVQRKIIPDRTDPQKSPVMERCQNLTFYCLKSDLELEHIWPSGNKKWDPNSIIFMTFAHSRCHYLFAVRLNGLT